MRQVRYAVVVASILAAAQGYATAFTPYEDLASKFFDLLSSGKHSEALDVLFRTNPYSEKITDSIQQLKSQLTSSAAMVGEYRGSSVLFKKEIGDRIAYMYYLVAYDREPMKFEFIFYKPGDKWILLSMNFSDKITDDIREFAKYDLLQKSK